MQSRRKIHKSTAYVIHSPKKTHWFHTEMIVKPNTQFSILFLDDMGVL